MGVHELVVVVPRVVAGRPVEAALAVAPAFLRVAVAVTTAFQILNRQKECLHRQGVSQARDSKTNGTCGRSPGTSMSSTKQRGAVASSSSTIVVLQ